ncbi:MAG: hypothetical protein GF350_02215 [Chitinivibrionales bacterium]|nr:hypothetical protein [Chitinivibrionales bacterium]
MKVRRKGFLIEMTKHEAGAFFVAGKFRIASALVTGGLVFACNASLLDSAKIFLMKGNYNRASAQINAAYAKDPDNPSVLCAYARFLKDARKAELLYSTLSEDKNAPDSVRAEALFRVGCLLYIKSEYESALGCFEKAFDNVPDASLQEYIQLCSTLAHNDGNESENGDYVLQVGSFASLENAQKKKGDLEKYFPDVTIQHAEIGGEKYFRVRLGAFKSKEDAEAFGRRKLEPKNIDYTALRNAE